MYSSITPNSQNLKSPSPFLFWPHSEKYPFIPNFYLQVPPVPLGRRRPYIDEILTNCGFLTISNQSIAVCIDYFLQIRDPRLHLASAHALRSLAIFLDFWTFAFRLTLICPPKSLTWSDVVHLDVDVLHVYLMHDLVPSPLLLFRPRLRAPFVTGVLPRISQGS